MTSKRLRTAPVWTIGRGQNGRRKPGGQEVGSSNLPSPTRSGVISRRSSGAPGRKKVTSQLRRAGPDGAGLENVKSR